MSSLENKIRKSKQIIEQGNYGLFYDKLKDYLKRSTIDVISKVITRLSAKIGLDGVSERSEYSFVSNQIFSITTKDIADSKKATRSGSLKHINTATWFVPYFNHLSFGGIYTIFRAINYMSERGVKCNIVIYDRPDLDSEKLKNDITREFPSLDSAELIIFDQSIDKMEGLPSSDIAFCTFWVSAYFLLRYNQTKRKYYFIQDYEPSFYEGGSIYALAESTYRFGFRGVVNTPGLLKAVNSRHGIEGISFIPAVEEKYYYPREKHNEGKIRIFFYARPANPRNAFNLGVIIIKMLVERYGDQIDIVTAGADWDESKYGLKGKITNMGLLKGLQEVGDLYRSCDIGFVYMLSKHPSYQPFEFMATGVATVTNNNEDNLWMLKDGINCLVSEPSPAAMAEKIGWLIDDKKLRLKIQSGGYDTISYDWDRVLDVVWNDIKNN